MFLRRILFFRSFCVVIVLSRNTKRNKIKPYWSFFLVLFQSTVGHRRRDCSRALDENTLNDRTVSYAQSSWKPYRSGWSSLVTITEYYVNWLMCVDRRIGFYDILRINFLTHCIINRNATFNNKAPPHLLAQIRFQTLVYRKFIIIVFLYINIDGGIIINNLPMCHFVILQSTYRKASFYVHFSLSFEQ